jgi:ribosomal protein S18 acetylase RimI-like enzyme
VVHPRAAPLWTLRTTVKLVIFVRAANTPAQAFYQALGFADCGRLTRRVILDGDQDNELLMEVFLDRTSAGSQPATRR